MLWKTNEFLILFLTLLAFGVAIEVGFVVGKRVASRRDEASTPHLGVIQAAVMGLLGLLFAFSLSMAVSRYEARKSLVLEESNNIGTLWLRCAFAPPEIRNELSLLLRDYVDARIDFHEAGLDTNRLTGACDRAEAIQAKLWTHASRLAATNSGSIPTGLFIQALNEVIDDFEERRVALDNHVPDTVMLLLFVNSVVALGFMAYGCGLSKRRRLWTSSIVALLFGLVLMIILDIDRPRRGFVLVNEDSMFRLRDTIREHIEKHERPGP